MEKLYLQPTKSTPEIIFDPTQHQLDLKGESYPENTVEFYRPVFEWLKQYAEKLESKDITVNIELIYFNSSTSKVLMDFFDILDSAAMNNNITVNWIYCIDDEDNLEYGEDFSEDLSNLNFKFISKD